MENQYTIGIDLESDASTIIILRRDSDGVVEVVDSQTVFHESFNRGNPADSQVPNNDNVKILAEAIETPRFKGTVLSNHALLFKYPEMIRLLNGLKEDSIERLLAASGLKI